MSDVHTSTLSLRQKLLLASGVTLAIAATSAAPAFAQANSDTTGHAAPKADSAVKVTPAPAQGKGGGFQLLSGGQGGMVFRMGPATPAKKVAGDSTKADSAKAATGTTKADAGKKP